MKFALFMIGLIVGVFLGISIICLLNVGKDEN